MKAAFELKLELAREQEALTKQSIAQKTRLLNEALEEERRNYSQAINKLRSELLDATAAAATTDTAATKK